MTKWQIHPSSIIDPSAEIHPEASIGPFCTIGEDVKIGAGTVLHANVHILSYVTIGANCQVFTGCVFGGDPQDTKFKGEKSYIEIGDNNILREYVTIHRATGEGCKTYVGNDNMLMAYTHLGHNSTICDFVTIASYGGVSGHVTIEDSATIGGNCGIHQFCSIGKLAMVGGMSGIIADVPPYMMVMGIPSKVYDINARGLRRANISPKVRGELRQAHKLLYRAGLNQAQALEAITEEIESSKELDHLLNFIRKSREGGSGRQNQV